MSISLLNGSWLKLFPERACIEAKTLSLVSRPFSTRTRQSPLSTAVTRLVEVDGGDGERLEEENLTDMKKSRGILERVNRMMAAPGTGRHFAVVHLGQ